MFTVKYYVKVVAGKQYLYQNIFHWIIQISTCAPKTNHDWFLNLNYYRIQYVVIISIKVSVTWYPHWKVFIYLLHKELKKVQSQSCSSYLILYTFLKICVFIN